MRALLFASLLAVFVTPASAQIYKYTDANGNTAFSSQPPNGTQAESVDLQPLPQVQTQREPAAPAGATPPAPASPATNPASAPAKPGAKGPPYSRLALTDLPTAEALRANNGSFTVGVDISPPLSGKRQVRLVLDGEVYGEPTTALKGLKLVNLDRGDHAMAVQVLEGDTIIQQSGDVEFTVQRVHQ